MLVAAIVLFGQELLQFGRVIAPGWNVDGLLVMAGVAAAAGYLYSRRLAHATFIWREWLVLLAPVVLLSRFVPYVTDPEASLAADLAAWVADPGLFLDAGWLARAALLVAAWAAAFYATQDLNAIRVQRGEIPDEPARTLIERAWEGERGRSLDHASPVRRLAACFLWGGVSLIFLAALTSSAATQTLGIAAAIELLSLVRPASSTALLSVVAYFVAVLLLLIEAQYARNRTLWLLDRAQIAENVPSRWAATGAVVVAVGLVASLLAPTEQLLGVGEIVRLVLLYLVRLLHSLFPPITAPPGTGTGDAPPAPPSSFALPVPPATAGEGSGPGDLIKSLLFWAIVGGAGLYSVWALWRERRHGRVGAVLRAIERLGGAARRLLRFFWGLLSRTAQTVGAAARRLIPAGAAAAARRARAWTVGAPPGRDPRRIVLALYAVMAARAAERGIVRRLDETASEYGLKLRRGLPDVSSEVEGLTEAFLRARYSRRVISDSDAGLARRAWGRIRARLRRPPGSP